MSKDGEITVFPGKPKTVVLSRDNVVAVATLEQIEQAHRSLEEVLKEVVENAKEYAKEIEHEFSYPDGKWFPCGFSSIRLSWTNSRTRAIIKLFKKQGSKDDNRFYRGYFGSMYKGYKSGYVWSPHIAGGQSMLFAEAVNNFIRQELLKANIDVVVESRVD